MDAMLPAQACEVVAEVTGYDLTPNTLRQWRNRGLFHGMYAWEDDRGGSPQSRFSAKQIFGLCLMAEALKRGITASTAAKFTGVGYDFGPGAGIGDWDRPNHYCVIPTMVGNAEDGLTLPYTLIANGPDGLLKVISQLQEIGIDSDFLIVLKLSSLMQRFVAAFNKVAQASA
jgi:hypothetical protein